MKLLCGTISSKDLAEFTKSGIDLGRASNITSKQYFDGSPVLELNFETADNVLFTVRLRAEERINST